MNREAPPRAAAGGNDLYLVLSLVCFAAAPLAAAAAAGWLLVVHATGWPPRRLAIGGVVGAVTVAAAGGAAGQLDLLDGWARAALSGQDPGGLAWLRSDAALAALAGQGWLAAPLGALLAGVLAWHASLGPEISPAARRAATKTARRQRKGARRRAEHITAGAWARPWWRRWRYGKPAAPDALGAAWGDGDLPQWRRGDDVVVPQRSWGLPMLILGATGFGKTETDLRLVAGAAQLDRQVLFVDGKGTDHELPERVFAAYTSARPDARLLAFPEQALCGWHGDPAAVVSRLMGVLDTSESAYHSEMYELCVRLAVMAPGLPPVTSAAQLLERFDADVLAEVWEGDPVATTQIRGLRKSGELVSVSGRFSNFFSALAGDFDGPADRDYHHYDCVMVRARSLVSKKNADAVIRMLLADLGHYAAARKPRELPVTALIDEFGAVEGARDRAVDLAERGRDPGLAVVFSSQTLAGLGTPADQQRLLGAASGGIIAHRTIDADPIVQLGGAVKRTELTWQLGPYGPTSEGSARRAYSARVDPDVLRNLEPGEAVIVEAGRQQLVNVAQVPKDREAVARISATLQRWRQEREQEISPRAKYDEIAPRTGAGGSQTPARRAAGRGGFDGDRPPGGRPR